MDSEKKYYDRWILKETDVLNRLHRYVSDTIRTAVERNDDFDSFEELLDILVLTIISELHDYYIEEYSTAYEEGLDGLIESEPDRAAAVESAERYVDGKNFQDRVAEYADKLYADVLLSADSDYTRAEQSIDNSLDLLVATDGLRVRSEARQAAGEELSSVGYIVTKTWRTMLDERVRYTHFELEGKTLPIDGWFETYRGRAQYPGGFGVAEEDCGCRCTIVIRAILPEEV